MHRNYGLIIRGVFCAMLAGSSCAPQGLSFRLDHSTTPQAEISSILGRQTAAWNRGDVEEFMGYYERSDQLTFSSAGQVTRGWDRTLARYRERYPSRNLMGTLTFDDLEVRMLSTEAALVLGRWHLEREQPTGGTFTLVFQKRTGRWLIVHDHTSVNAP